MHIRTKIVCTMGPSVATLEKMIALIKAGMSVARLNFSHGTHDDHAKTIALLKEARERTQTPLAIMLDTKGPEVRVGQLKKPVSVEPGTILSLSRDAKAAKETHIPIVPVSVLHTITKGANVLFDDGLVSTRVVEVLPDAILVEGLNTGEIRSGKGVNIPGVDLNLPMVTEQDEADIRFGCRQGIDIIAASFVCYPEHLAALKAILSNEKASDTLIASKIETRHGVDNFDAILQVSDAIMIARGDLGVEVPLSEVPGLQKMMIRRCYEVGKPSIVATQMLESMTQNLRPTRAEASDVANAIFESASSVMLSGETAIGRYPIETVNTMRNIVTAAENEFDYQQFYSRIPVRAAQSVPTSVSLASVKTAISASASAIFVITTKGITARLISRLRPKMPILTLTTSRKVYHQLAFNWGVVPIYCEKVSSFEEAFKALSEWALEKGYVRQGDLVVVTSGMPFGKPGTTNQMVVESIGNVLLRGHQGVGKRVTGKIALVTEGEELPDPKGKILVISRITDGALRLLKGASGVILHALREDFESEKTLLKMAKELDLPAIIAIDAAATLLTEGETATLDPTDALVYKGALH